MFIYDDICCNARYVCSMDWNGLGWGLFPSKQSAGKFRWLGCNSVAKLHIFTFTQVYKLHDYTNKPVQCHTITVLHNYMVTKLYIILLYNFTIWPKMAKNKNFPPEKHRPDNYLFPTFFFSLQMAAESLKLNYYLGPVGCTNFGDFYRNSSGFNKNVLLKFCTKVTWYQISW